MSYVQGFVIPVPVAKKDAYRELAAKTAPIFQEYGATRIVECWGDDLPEGKTTDFRRAVKARKARMSSSRGSSGPTGQPPMPRTRRSCPIRGWASQISRSRSTASA